MVVPRFPESSVRRRDVPTAYVLRQFRSSGDGGISRLQCQATRGFILFRSNFQLRLTPQYYIDIEAQRWRVALPLLRSIQPLVL